MIELYKQHTADLMYQWTSNANTLYIVDDTDLDIVTTDFDYDVFDDYFIYGNYWFPEYGFDTFL
jgi:hypothetical protein